MPKIGEVNKEGLIYSDSFDGKPRWLKEYRCQNPECEKKFLSRKHKVQKFCSVECRSESKKNRVKLVCSNCGKSFERTESKLKSSKSGFYFCSRSCKEFAQSLDGDIDEIKPLHYGEGKHPETYRRRAFRRFGTTCNRCGYNEDGRMLDVHHKDGNRDNSGIDNLEVLCVWCHALETRKDWKPLNERFNI